MRLSWLFIFLGLCVAQTAQANIGDDLNTLRKKYGPAHMVSSQQFVFLEQKESISIAVYFDNDKSAMEVFLHEQKENGTTDDLTLDDVRKILAQQIDSTTAWREATTANGQTFWVRTDNKVIAHYNDNESPKTLVFMAN